MAFPALFKIERFLSNRQQRVNVNGLYSEQSNCTSGILQGSVLGPLLFIIYMHNMNLILPFLLTAISNIDLLLSLRIKISYNLILISLLNGVKSG